MKAIALAAPGKVKLTEVPEPVREEDEFLLQVDMVGLCGTDLNSFRGKTRRSTTGARAWAGDRGGRGGRDEACDVHRVCERTGKLQDAAVCAKGAWHHGLAQCPAPGFHQVIKLLESGRFPVDRVTCAVVPLPDAPHALAQWSDDPARFTEMLVNVSGKAAWPL